MSVEIGEHENPRAPGMAQACGGCPPLRRDDKRATAAATTNDQLPMSDEQLISDELLSMNVRAARPEDRAEWLRLICALYAARDEAEHAADIDAFFAGRPAGRPHLAAVFVCAHPSGGLTGVLELSVRDYAEGCAGSTPYVESWFVDSGWRRRGIGGRLMSAAEAWARERGYSELASDTLLDNERSLHAHRALGFAEVERSIHLRKAL